MPDHTGDETLLLLGSSNEHKHKCNSSRIHKKLFATIVSCLFILFLFINVCYITYYKHPVTKPSKFQSRAFYRTSPHHIRMYSNGTTEHLVPLCDPQTKQHSGYISLSNKLNDHYFYWFFEARENPEIAPLVIWLTGGPGCSSMFALLKENGPCKMNNQTGTIEKNPYSWNTVANILWIDQPTGVGFSYGETQDYDHNEQNVKENLWAFLQGFLQRYPEYQMKEFYLTGESYGGHYIPATAEYIYQKNKQLAKNETQINLKGIAIGNGLTNTIIQSAHYLDLAVNNSYNIQLVDNETYQLLREDTPTCVNLAIECQTNDEKCPLAEQYCITHQLEPIVLPSQRNPYDLRLQCDMMKTPMCYDSSAVDSFLNDKNVQEQLHVETDRISRWLECNFEINRDFSIDMMKSFNNSVAPLLNNNIRVLIYAGDADLMCNWKGNDAWTKQLIWKGNYDFNHVQNKIYDVEIDGQIVHSGELRSAQGLSFLRVYNAGHMVPMDQPVVAIQLFKDFLANSFH